MTLTSKEYFLKNVKIGDKITYEDNINNTYHNYTIEIINEVSQNDDIIILTNNIGIIFVVDFENKKIVSNPTGLYTITHIRDLNVSSFFLDENNLSDNNEIKDKKIVETSDLKSIESWKYIENKKEITINDLSCIVRTGHTIEYFSNFKGLFCKDKVIDLEGNDNSFIIIGNNIRFTIDFSKNKIYSSHGNNLKLIKVGDLDLSNLFENNLQPNKKIETPNQLKNNKKSVLISTPMVHNPEIKQILDSIEYFNGIAIDPQETGSKFDNGKNRIGLLFTDFAIALKEIAKVATFGAKKYSDHNWRLVDNKKKRYQDALSRHILDYFEDNNSLDDESKVLHLAHAGWNILSLLVIQLTEGKK